MLLYHYKIFLFSIKVCIEFFGNKTLLQSHENFEIQWNVQDDGKVNSVKSTFKDFSEKYVYYNSV